jgi:PAP2 superfamily
MSQPIIAVTPRLPASGWEALREIGRQSPFLMLGLVMLVLSEILGMVLGSAASVPLWVRIAGFVYFLMLNFLFVLPMLFFRLLVFEKPASPTRALLRSVWSFYTSDNRFSRGLVTLAAVFLFISSFATLKASITLVQPFAWDQAFDELDRWLHFGYRPWELLAPLLNYPPITTIISINYHAWFMGLALYWTYFAFDEKPGVLRTQSLMAFMLTWSFGGVGLAMLFSSAGPCFFGHLDLGHDPYAPLMTYLHTTGQTWPIWALDVQQWLWTNYENGTTDLAKGISAMPSMHNAQCLLLVLAVWNKARIVRNLAIIHGVLVFLGSVQLGWHYAVDAYLAWIVVGVAWVVSGAFARFWEGRAALSPAVSRP